MFWGGEESAAAGIITFEIACFVGYFLKGFSGFGPALVFVPVAAYLFSPSVALGSSALVDLFVGGALLAGLRYTREDWRTVARISVFMVMGTIPGGMLAGMIPGRLLLVLIGGVVFGLGLHSLAGSRTGRVPEKNSRSRMLCMGSFLGGFTGGLVGISGPFVVMAARQGMHKGTFRKTMVAVFFIEGIARLLVYRAGAVWGSGAIDVAVLAAPAVMIGLISGSRLHMVVSEAWFGRVLGAILIGIAVQVGFHALG